MSKDKSLELNVVISRKKSWVQFLTRKMTGNGKWTKNLKTYSVVSGKILDRFNASESMSSPVSKTEAIFLVVFQNICSVLQNFDLFSKLLFQVESRSTNWLTNFFTRRSLRANRFLMGQAGARCLMRFFIGRAERAG
jgi:hypothetical protein